jgi:hypothetical protein
MRPPYGPGARSGAAASPLSLRGGPTIHRIVGPSLRSRRRSRAKRATGAFRRPNASRACSPPRDAGGSAGARESTRPSQRIESPSGSIARCVNVLTSALRDGCCAVHLALRGPRSGATARLLRVGPRPFRALARPSQTPLQTGCRPPLRRVSRRKGPSGRPTLTSAQTRYESMLSSTAFSSSRAARRPSAPAMPAIE